MGFVQQSPKILVEVKDPGLYMSGLKVNVIVEDEISMYENDERLISENSTWGKWVGVKVNNEKYLFIKDDSASHLERVKFILNGRLPGKYFLPYHFNLGSFTKFGY